MKAKYIRNIFLIGAASIIFAGCASEPNYLVNLSFVKDAVIGYQENGGFHKDAKEAVEKAEKEFDKIIPGKHSVVIFDVDETALSNYDFYKKMDFGYIPEFQERWEMQAKAPAVVEVFNLYKFLINKGFKIIFISGRKSYEHGATKKNLVDVGYTEFDTLILKDKNDLSKTALEFKSEKRAELTLKGYNIVGTVGDQWSDLDGPYHGIQVKIPDYQYFIK